VHTLTGPALGSFITLQTMDTATFR
jgi:hypothetical protein